MPLDFNYPLKMVWYGYYDLYAKNVDRELVNSDFCHKSYSASCEGCKAYAEIKGIKILDNGCPDFISLYGTESRDLKKETEIPKGLGYQLWETTSEGSPISPVFENLDDLCVWCSDNTTIFANYKLSPSEWKECISDKIISFRCPDLNIIVI